MSRIEGNLPQLNAIVAGMKSKIQPGTGDGPEALGEIVTCSGEKTMGGTKFGINNVRWAVLAATGLGDGTRKIEHSDMTIEETRPSSDEPFNEEVHIVP